MRCKYLRRYKRRYFFISLDISTLKVCNTIGKCDFLFHVSLARQNHNTSNVYFVAHTKRTSNEELSCFPLLLFFYLLFKFTNVRIMMCFCLVKSKIHNHVETTLFTFLFTNVLPLANKFLMGDIKPKK